MVLVAGLNSGHSMYISSEVLHHQYVWENECCACNCKTMKCLKLMEVWKQKYVT